MNWMDEWIQETGFKVGVWIAGALGSVASFLKPQNLKWYERCLTVFVGGFSAMYLTPPFLDWVSEWKQIGQSGELAVAYLIGYSGLKSIEMGISKVKSTIQKK